MYRSLHAEARIVFSPRKFLTFFKDVYVCVCGGGGGGGGEITVWTLLRAGLELDLEIFYVSKLFARVVVDRSAVVPYQRRLVGYVKNSRLISFTEKRSCCGHYHNHGAVGDLPWVCCPNVYDLTAQLCRIQLLLFLLGPFDDIHGDRT